MSSLQTYLGNVRAVNGRLTTPPENDPAPFTNRGYPYDNLVSNRFYQEYAKYASDYFENVQAQGLNPDDFFAWEIVTMRMADLVKESAAMQRQFDNHKMVLLDKMRYSYVPRGAKFINMGSTWLVTNPINISGSDGMCVVQRCNTTWNHLDWYGNVVKEPIVFETEILRANAPDPQYNMNIVKGYFNVKCQRNADTAQINDNTRMILGSSCYVVSGYSDFEQEFTGDYDSVHFLEFTIRKDEPDATIDDMVNHVAGGLKFSWNVTVAGTPVIQVGDNHQFTASSERCGEAVSSSVDYPITYAWTSSDETVATVDENGIVTGISTGQCFITATLEQNEAWENSYPVTIADEYTEDVIWFSKTVNKKLNAYESITLNLIKYRGYETKDYDLVPSEDLVPGAYLYPSEEFAIEWEFSGADENAYSVETDGAICTIHCWSGCDTPLTVTAICGPDSVSAVIELIGI